MKFKQSEEKLTIIAHLPHFKKQNTWVAYEPYVKEIEIWAKLFKSITIYTDIKKGSPSFPVKCLPDNCHIKPIYLTSGPGLKNNVLRFCQTPLVIFHILIILLRSDYIHLRSPGASTFFANLLNRLTNKKVIVKWATTFEEMPDTSRIVKWERSLLIKPPSNTKVLIYGIGTHTNHISFIPALFTKNDLSELEKNCTTKDWNPKKKLLCVGRLFRYKSFDIAINGLVKFKKKYPNLDWELKMVGDGEMRETLENAVKEGGINDYVQFLGSRSFQETKSWYSKSHIVIMPGMYEGWPKVINEAWATGCIPFVVNVKSAIFPLTFAPGSGIIFEPDPESFADSLFNLFSKSPEELSEIAAKGKSANQLMTLEQFQIKLEKVIDEMI